MANFIVRIQNGNDIKITADRFDKNNFNESIEFSDIKGEKNGEVILEVVAVFYNPVAVILESSLVK